MLIFIISLLVILKKLLPNPFDKETYIIGFEISQLYLRISLKLSK